MNATLIILELRSYSIRDNEAQSLYLVSQSIRCNNRIFYNLVYTGDVAVRLLSIIKMVTPVRRGADLQIKCIALT